MQALLRGPEVEHQAGLGASHSCGGLSLGFEVMGMINARGREPALLIVEAEQLPEPDRESRE